MNRKHSLKKMNMRICTIILSIIMIVSLSAPCSFAEDEGIQADNGGVEMIDEGSAEGDSVNDDSNIASEDTEIENEAEKPLVISYPDTGIKTQVINGEEYLFLPSDADKHRLVLDFGREEVRISEAGKFTEEIAGDSVSGSESDDSVEYAGKRTGTPEDDILCVVSGSEFDMASIFEDEPEDGIYRINVDGKNVNLMFSENIASVYLKSYDMAKDRKWVEKSKDNKAKGAMEMKNADGSVVYDGELTQIKGRGNSSWTYPKKPYQIKLAKATDLNETGIEDEKNKTWILLAGHSDKTLLHNQYTYDLARAMDLEFTPYCRQVNLYYDGEYRGVYLLIEKTEVGTGRVDIEDLASEIEKKNRTVKEFGDLSQASMRTKSGVLCHYINRISMPGDITGGYLLEMDFMDRAMEEKSYFYTKNGQAIVSKSPEFLPKAGMAYIADLYQQFEDAIYNGGTHPENKMDYSSMIDVESLAKLYILEELSMDVDAFLSSNYIYKKAGVNSKLTFGPAWDFDNGYGDLIRNPGQMSNVEYLWAADSELMKTMLKIPSFQETVKQVYNKYYGVIKSLNENELVEHMSEISSAVRMNSILWPDNTEGDAGAAQSEMQKYIDLRSDCMHKAINSWDGTPVKICDYFDVYSADWFLDDVRYVTEKKIFKGTSPGVFSPYNEMTRAMVVTVLYRLEDSPMVDNPAELFEDVSKDFWGADAIAWAVESGITKGTGEGCFSPDKSISRQEFATMLYRYQLSKQTKSESEAKSVGIDDEELEKIDVLAKFYDYSDVSSYAIESMGWAVENGILKGSDSNLLMPTGTLNRAQASAMIHRLLEK